MSRCPRTSGNVSRGARDARVCARGDRSVEGERADGMHIVLRGVVKVVRFAPDGREMVLHLVRKGNTIGEAAMFQKGTFPAVRRGRGSMWKPCSFRQDALFTLVTENPEMALRMLAALSLRLRMFAHKLAAQGQGGAACPACHVFAAPKADWGWGLHPARGFPGSARQSARTGP